MNKQSSLLRFETHPEYNQNQASGAAAKDAINVKYKAVKKKGEQADKKAK
jgi:hypothetical protein